MRYLMSRLHIVLSSVLLLLVMLSAGCAEETALQSRVETLPYYEDATFTPHWLEPGSDSLEGFHKISSFSLINQLGDTITDIDFEGKMYITDFFFTFCPGICPKMTSNMHALQEAFSDDEEVLLLSHSVMPMHDSVAALKDYAENKGVEDGKWHLVTGDRQEIYRLGRESYFVEEDLGIPKDIDDFLHTENFVLVDKHKHIRGIYNGLNETAIQQLITDVRTLGQEE